MIELLDPRHFKTVSKIESAIPSISYARENSKIVKFSQLKNIHIIIPRQTRDLPLCKLYILASMWDQNTNHVCFTSSYECNLVMKMRVDEKTFSLKVIDPTPKISFANNQKWKIDSEITSVPGDGRHHIKLTPSVECLWNNEIPLENVSCQFLFKIT
jgi:hypothetical protein